MSEKLLCWKCQEPLKGDDAFHTGYHRRCLDQDDI